MLATLSCIRIVINPPRLSGSDSGDPYQPACWHPCPFDSESGSSFLIDGGWQRVVAPPLHSTNLTSVLIIFGIAGLRVDSQTSPGHCGIES
jgi:hypothetical protein